MDIQVFHKYRALADAGKAKPLSCDRCDNPYVTRVTKDADPVLQCAWCNTLTQPGYGMYNRILAIVREHYV